MPSFYGAVTHIGGTLGALDAINGAQLNDQDGAFVVTSTAPFRVDQYYLDADSGESESSPDIISPDTNPGTKRWKRANVYMLGNAALTELTISSGSVTPTRAYHSVDTEADAATDDLANIVTTYLPEGALLLIRAADGSRDVVVKHNAGGAGQIALLGALDKTLSATDQTLMLIREGTDWREVFLQNGALLSGVAATLSAGYDSETTQITDGASPTITLTASNYFRWTLGATRTFPDLTITKAGQWEFAIDGAYALTFHANYKISTKGDAEYDSSIGKALVSLKALNVAGTIEKWVFITNLTEA